MNRIYDIPNPPPKFKYALSPFLFPLPIRWSSPDGSVFTHFPVLENEFRKPVREMPMRMLILRWWIWDIQPKLKFLIIYRMLKKHIEEQGNVKKP